ncbi:unnamed protein product, partial [Iphiclides podalirius]
MCDASMSRSRKLPPKRQVYWWSTEIAQMRRACLVARRRYTRCRRRRRRDLDLETELYTSFRQAKMTLQAAIASAIAVAREEFLAALNRDPWGRQYRMREEHSPPSMARPSTEMTDPSLDIPEVTPGEFGAAVLRMKLKSAAPGPDGIPGRAWALALGDALEPRLREMFTACLAQAIIPQRWKTGRLVLIRKQGRPMDSPSAYRPIVLLDDVGKLFERVVAGRIVEHLENVGPNLAERQFGFRKGRSTIHAVLQVRSLAQEAVSQGGVVLAVSLDIANAFNTLPWACIREALRFHGVPLYLRRTIEAYLSHRRVEFPCQDGHRTIEVTCGVSR